MDTQDREKYRQLRQQQRERQLHIIRLSILLGVGVILMFTGLGLLTYVHQQKQTVTSGNVSERFSEAASSAALETASRNDLDTETAAATEKAQKKQKKQSQTTDVSTFFLRFSIPASALFMRVLASKRKGFVTTPTVRMPISFAIPATTGEAPVPVPPPIPQVTNTMSAPCIACLSSSELSSAA